MVEAHTGAPLVPGTIDADARVEAIGDEGYRLTLVVEHAAIRQERMLVARECDALAHASALVIALGVDAAAVAQVEHETLAQPLPPTAVDTIAEPRLTAQPVPVPIATPPPRARPAARRVHAVLALVGGVERGGLPRVTGGIDGAIGLRGRGFRIELAGTWLAPRLADIAVGSVRVQLGAVALRGGPELQLRRLSFPLCVGLELGAMRGAGRDAPGAHTVNGVWVAPTISPGVRVRVGPIALVARGEVAIPVQRPSFQLREPGKPIAVFTPGPVSLRLWLGIEFRVGARDGSGPRWRTSGVRRG